MPWKTSGAEKERRRFVQARLAGQATMSELCRQFGISRQCGHKWWRRFQAEGRKGLKRRSQETAYAARQEQRWRGAVLRLRRKHARWGAPKLQWWLRQQRRRGPWPSSATIGRWLKRAGLTRRRPDRARPGPVQTMPPRGAAGEPNAVWTVDFKGSFYTQDRRRVCALTVRDLATRYVLAVRHVQPTEAVVARVLQRLFAQQGRPRAIRTDNGPPFGSTGPRGWTPLTLGWVRQGIRVEFGRPGCPQDNAGHEQMHGVLKQATAQPAAANLAAQQRRFDRWRRHYNALRPHDALGRCPPAWRYASRRRLSARVPTWSYPCGCQLRRLDARGRIRWGGRSRHIGRAFARQHLGFKRKTSQLVEVYFGPHLLGTLHHSDRAGLRPVQWRRPCRG